MLAQLINKEPGLTVCAEAEEIPTALVMAGQLQPHLIVSDLMFAGPSGLDLIADLKARDLRIPVLMLSMHEEPACVNEAVRQGARGYVSKQEPATTVIAAIRALLSGETYFSEKIKRVVEQSRLIGTAAPDLKMELLSDLERQILRLVGLSFDSAEIAAQLDLALSEVDECRSRIREKLELKSGAELYQNAVRFAVGLRAKA